MPSRRLYDSPDGVHNDDWLVDRHDVTGLLERSPDILDLTARLDLVATGASSRRLLGHQ